MIIPVCLILLFLPILAAIILVARKLYENLQEIGNDNEFIAQPKSRPLFQSSPASKELLMSLSSSGTVKTLTLAHGGKNYARNR